MDDKPENLKNTSGRPSNPASENSQAADSEIAVLAADQTRTTPDIWNAVQADLQRRLGERVHKSWTGQLSLRMPAHTDDSSDDVVLTAPSRFVAGRIDGKYGDLVRQLWAEHGPHHVHIMAASETPRPKPASAPVRPSAKQQIHAAPQAAPAQYLQMAQAKPNASPRARFTFDNFVIGPSNELAHAVAKRVASAQASPYNPIVIYGPHGMGKTHLLYAVQAHIAQTDPARRVRLISAEEFVGSFVQSVRAQGRGEIEAFKLGLRDVDLLIIDDTHFIADKPGSQEELLHTLIALVDEGKQILLACDRHPHAIEKAGSRLKSYLTGGLLCDIGAADYELRVRILDRLIEKRRENGHPALSMPRNARDHLAARINATPRDLEGAFNQVLARSEFLGQPLTLENVQDALSQSRYGGTVRPSVDKIQKACAKEFGITVDEILSKRRSRAIARPRQAAMYLCKQMTTRSLPDIGRRFGGRDHTTVIHAVKRIEALRAEDKTLDSQIEAVIEALKTA